MKLNWQKAPREHNQGEKCRVYINIYSSEVRKGGNDYSDFIDLTAHPAKHVQSHYIFTCK